MVGNGGNATGEHYITHTSLRVVGSEHLPFSAIAAAKAQHQMPSYDSFWSNHSFCGHVVGCLYRSDLLRYLETCAAPLLRGCRAFRAACQEQLTRLRDVCGLNIDQVTRGNATGGTVPKVQISSDGRDQHRHQNNTTKGAIREEVKMIDCWR